jgi:simple sugar transport system permease protein
MTNVLKLVVKLQPLWAIVAALLVGAVLMALAGSDPIAAYTSLFHGAFFDYWGLANTLVKASPIIFSAPRGSGAGAWRDSTTSVARGRSYRRTCRDAWSDSRSPMPRPSSAFPRRPRRKMAGGASWRALRVLLRAYRGINEVIVTC